MGCTLRRLNRFTLTSIVYGTRGNSDLGVWVRIRNPNMRILARVQIPFQKSNENADVDPKIYTFCIFFKILWKDESYSAGSHDQVIRQDGDQLQIWTENYCIVTDHSVRLIDRVNTFCYKSDAISEDAIVLCCSKSDKWVADHSCLSKIENGKNNSNEVWVFNAEFVSSHHLPWRGQNQEGFR